MAHLSIRGENVARALRGSAPLIAMGFLGGCAVAAAAQQESENVPESPNPIVQLLEAGNPVFGIFSGDHTREQGVVRGRNREVDFVFYSLESGPFDIPAMKVYMEGLEAASGSTGPHPVALRIPPIRDGHELARDRVRQGLEAGVAAVVFPHVETAEEAALAVDALGADQWPGDAGGSLVSILLIEDQIGVANAREIVGTPGVGVVFPGPGDLRRAYESDMDAVEEAIQTVLAACKEHDVPCGITADADDIAVRLEQGFRVFIVQEPEVLTVGRAASGRGG